MPHDRFFLEHHFQENCQVTLAKEESHHLIRVMRKKIGDHIELINGKGQLAYARMVEIHRYGVDLILLTIVEKSPSLSSTILCQALPRSNRLDTIVEKGTELGMDEIWLFPSTLSEKKEIGESQIKRLRSIAIAATKQSGRLFLPKIQLKPPLSKWAKIEPPAYFGEPSEKAPPFLQLYQADCKVASHSINTKDKPLFFFIGPESGFTCEERQHLIDLGVKGASLHPNVLRVDTAALAALIEISIAKY